MFADPADRLRLLSQLQRLLRERLAPRMQTLFDELDLRLFDLAERSRIGAQQHLYFDGLRECRRKRGDIERDFLDAVLSNLRPATTNSGFSASTPLSLVPADELEEALALSGLVERTTLALAVPLDALDRRLSALLNRARIADEAPRLGPQAMCQAFRTASQRLDAGIEVRLVAYALFGRHVLDALDVLYAELNRELVAAGVLPALPSPGVRKPAARPELRETQTTRDTTIPNLLRDLRDLLAERETAPSRAANAVPPTLPRDSLLRALDRLASCEDDPRRLKSELLAQSRRLGAEPDAALVDYDEDTVDLVGLVFDFVRHDPNLPLPMQPLLTRLQIPFLKAALADPELLQAPEHPARHLIDELGEAAVGWTPGTDPENQLLDCIARIADQLLNDRGDGRVAFERAIGDLREHQDLGRRRAELAEQRAVEAALGRERLRIARNRVASTLERRLTRYTPLPWVRQLVRGPWANYLVLAWLRQGETGEAYRAALDFVDELLWCDEHGISSGDESRLRDDEEMLDEELRHGLAAVAYHDREIERLAGELRQFLISLRRRAKAPGFLYEIDPKLGTADFSQSWAEHELEDQPPVESLDAAVLAQIRALSPGTWFEFGARHDERAKLSWSSPFTGRCLFVNRNGLRVGEFTPERLADEIERGLTRILENTRLMQRALQMLVTQLREQSSTQRMA